jgi:Cu(I)/Ag(I) efflux system membrane protein CusA/SilA
MKRIAAPMIGGLFTSFLMELLVYPAIYYRWRVRYSKGDFNETTSTIDGNHYRVLETVTVD